MSGQLDYQKPTLKHRFKKTASSKFKNKCTQLKRKIQCLFRNGEVTRLIKKCNDFGAGGVCVGGSVSLADGLNIDLKAVPVKYSGLNGAELAVSESQEAYGGLSS